MSTLMTKPGRLSEIARRMVLPSGLVSNEWPSIRQRCETMGVRLDQWQADLVRGATAKRDDGKYAATVGGVVWSLPRQVGKTFTVGALLFALCAERPGSLVLWTSHHTRTTGETFRSMQSMAKRRRVAPYIDQVLRGAGTQAILFRNGSRILFGARDQGFGLGFAAVDVIVFDEAQRLNDQTRVDMVPATNRAHNPAGALLFYIGTPPRPGDHGDAFAALRASAIAGESDDTFYVELGADPDADPDDRAQWVKGNPSYPTHTPLESMLRMRVHLGDDESWRREALGIWDVVATGGVIPDSSWADQEDFDIATGEASIATDRFALGLECGRDLEFASIALAGKRADNGWHIELVDDQNTKGRGVAWLVPVVQDLVAKNPQIRTVKVDVGGPIAALLEKRSGRWYFRGTRLRVSPVTVSELGVGCAQVLSGIVTGSLWHIGQPQLSTAALSAGKRDLGDTGMWVWSRKSATSDITPVQAATLALIGAQEDRPVKSGNSTATSGRTSGRKAVVI